jgi:hypothetical protein
MRKIKIGLIFLLALAAGCMLFVCKSGPGTKDPKTGSGAEDVFDPASISQELYNETKSDVQKFVEVLNSIIGKKDYVGWKSNLSEEYFNKIASQDYLREASEQPAMKLQKITLRSAEDFFINVVVPSRTNSHVEDIEFISLKVVKVYTISPKNERLRLYELEKTGNTWKIIN